MFEWALRIIRIEFQITRAEIIWKQVIRVRKRVNSCLRGLGLLQ